MTTIITRGAASAQALGYAARATAANYIEDVFSTYLYNGSNSAQTITTGIDLSTYGGLLWLKGRNVGSAFGYGDHELFDSANVGSTRSYLRSDGTGALSINGSISTTPFTTSGFNLTAGPQINNRSGDTNVAWTFRKQAKFFDIVTWAGNGSAQTLAHSLGSVPGAIIVKDTNGNGNWAVYHRSLGNDKWIKLNSSDAAATASASFWDLTNPTSSNFTVGTAFSNININYVAYLFAHNAGGFGASGTDNVISCGSFTWAASGTTNVTLGWEPQWILVKRTDASGSWELYDNMRGMPVSGLARRLQAQDAAAEQDSGGPKPTSTGFSVSGFGVAMDMIYIAIRRGPMKTPTSGTSVYEPVSFTGNNTANTTRGTTITTDLAIISATNAGSPQATYNQAFYDRLRGEDVSLTSSDTNAEVTGWGNTYFNLDQQIGWSNGSNTAYLNNSSITYVTYNLRRAPGFFDEVCYNGASGGAVSHNLGVSPELIIIKNRNAVASGIVYSSALGLSSYVLLFSDVGSNAAGTLSWMTSVSSTAFQPTNNAQWNGSSSSSYVAYLFASCPGVSKVGSYTGTGALQTVNCGFTSGARFVLIKRTDSTGDWWVYDSARGITSGSDPYLFLNSTAAEVTGTNYVDTDTTGFKVTAAAPAGLNANGGSFIYLAIA